MAAGKAKIVIAGFVPFTNYDYPGQIAATVYLQGCPWRCAYCSNPHMIDFRRGGEEDDARYAALVDFMRRRARILDAVVFSGGEATAQADGLAATIKELRESAPGLRIGLHTNGFYPDALERVLPLVNWVGLDAKAPLDKYDSITGVAGSALPFEKSLALLAASGVEFEVRTTAYPKMLGKEDILGLAQWLAARGVSTYALQCWRPVGLSEGEADPHCQIFFQDAEFRARLESLFARVIFRS